MLGFIDLKWPRVARRSNVGLVWGIFLCTWLIFFQYFKLISQLLCTMCIAIFVILSVTAAFRRIYFTVRIPRELIVDLGWGLLSLFPLFRYFPDYSALWIHTLAIEYHIYIWQVSPQLSCADTCQIWMWLKEFNRNFSKVENFAYGECNEKSFSNPHPWVWDSTAWSRAVQGQLSW